MSVRDLGVFMLQGIPHRINLSDVCESVIYSNINLVQVWRHLRQVNYFKQPGNNETMWARRFYVQARALREMDDLVRELSNRLSREGIDASKAPSPWNKNNESLPFKVSVDIVFSVGTIV